MLNRSLEEQMVADYLLGALPESEIERLDKLSLTDDEFAHQIRDVENNLVDAYVRGELSGENLDRFKSHYLLTPGRREKVAFAEAFVRHIDKIKIKSFTPAIHWSVAASAIFLLMAGTYFLFDETDQQQRFSKKQEVRRPLKRATVMKKPGTVKLSAFHLSPPTRGITELPLFSVPFDTDFIILTLEMEVDDFQAYAAVMKDPTTDQFVYRSDNLTSRSNYAVEVKLPADLLKTQSYFLELYGISKEAEPEILNIYSFKVVKDSKVKG